LRQAGRRRIYVALARARKAPLEQFVTPLELTSFARAAGLRRRTLRGMVYDPFRRDWRLSSDMAVIYLFAATKPGV
jgi:2-polyprenyl-3-methyl-5-hydroxy-6-metoxy-1,4-benzoquinol methylase